jgi:hypothetical protein
MPCYDCHHRNRRDVVYVLLFSLVLAVFFLMLGVAVFGIHICGDEVAMIGQLVGVHWQGVVSRLVGGVGAVVDTFRGGRS